jgi:hypothetical protein
MRSYDHNVMNSLKKCQHRQMTDCVKRFYVSIDRYYYMFVHYSALLHLPPLRFHCADGCWDRIQDRCNLCIGSQTL